MSQQFITRLAAVILVLIRIFVDGVFGGGTSARTGAVVAEFPGRTEPGANLASCIRDPIANVLEDLLPR